MRRDEVEGLDAHVDWWVPAVVAPVRDWPPAPGCNRGARYLVHPGSLTPTRDDFTPFDSRLACLNWIMSRRSDLTTALPGAVIRAVRLDRWLLGLD